MVTAASSRRFTIDDLEQFPDDGKRRELVDGEIVEWDVPNFEHAFFMHVLARIIGLHVLERRLGAVVEGDLMVRILGSRHNSRGARHRLLSAWAYSRRPPRGCHCRRA